MSSLVAYASGTTTAVATLVNPPGLTGGGPKNIIIENIAWSIQTTAGSNTVAFIDFKTDGNMRYSLWIPTTAASSNGAGQFNWTQGLPLLPTPTAGAQIFLDSGASATACKLIVTYRYEF